MNRSKLLSLFTALAVVLALASSCASASRKAAAAKGDKILLNATEYETVYVTGSLLPVRVPKVGTAQALPAISPVATMSPEAFRSAVNPARGQARR